MNRNKKVDKVPENETAKVSPNPTTGDASPRYSDLAAIHRE